MHTPTSVRPGAEAWTARGDGDRAATAVVLVHGYTGNPKATRPLGEVLHRAGFSVDVLRLPGHGTTSKDLGSTNYADWRTTVTAAVDQALRAHDRVVLVGHSMGGALSLDLAGHRDDIAGVVAINAIVETPPNPLARAAPVLKFLVRSLPREAAGLPDNDIAMPGVDEDAYESVPFRTTLSLTEALPRVRAGLATLTAPLLVVSSRVDHTVDPHNSDIIMAEVASSDRRRLWAERSWHLPQLDWERSDVEEAIRDFVVDVHEQASG